MLYDALIAGTPPAGIALFKVVNYLGRWQVLLPGTLLLIGLAPVPASRHGGSEWLR